MNRRNFVRAALAAVAMPSALLATQQPVRRPFLRLVSHTKTPVYLKDGTFIGYREFIRFERATP